MNIYYLDGISHRRFPFHIHGLQIELCVLHYLIAHTIQTPPVGTEVIANLHAFGELNWLETHCVISESLRRALSKVASASYDYVHVVKAFRLDPMSQSVIDMSEDPSTAEKACAEIAHEYGLRHGVDYPGGEHYLVRATRLDKSHACSCRGCQSIVNITDSDVDVYNREIPICPGEIEALGMLYSYGYWFTRPAWDVVAARLDLRTCFWKELRV